MNGIILSAGFGKRLQPFTLASPKPGIPFLSIPLAVYPLSLLQQVKIENLVVNTHHLPQKVESLFQSLNWPCQNLIFSAESEKILDSGGGVRKALPNLLGKKDFFVVNSDEVILPVHHHAFKDGFDFHRFHKGIATLFVIEHPEVGSKFGGAWVKNGTQITQFSKTPIANHKGYHYIGLMILSDRIERYFLPDSSKEENILYDTLTAAIKNDEEVHVHPISAKWFEIGNPIDFLHATQSCLNAMKINQQEPWVEYLKQIIRINTSWPPIVEMQNPEILQQLNELIPKVKSGQI